MPSASPFAFDDTASFNLNLVAYAGELNTLDATGAPILAAALPALADERQDKGALRQALLIAMEKVEDRSKDAPATRRGPQASPTRSAGS